VSPELTDSFALLDDSSASAADPRSRLYTGLVRVLACTRASDLGPMLERMQHELSLGLHAVGLFEYELGARMHGVLPDPPGLLPLAQILLYQQCRRMSASDVEQWLEERDDGAPAGVAAMRSVDEAGFAGALERIQAYIEGGDSYQVNYTVRIRFEAYGAPLALYRRLRARQPVPYGALVALPDGSAVLSLSPELFVRKAGADLIVRPMKGTAAASGNDEQDLRRAAELACDPKNRAENVMIVDLLRNDLGRVARVGSVRASQLFKVERYRSVLQMTSMVEAELHEGASLAEIFSALYPCGSITGAPKRRTMQIIDELESDPRGLYTGALGWFEGSKEGKASGDFCLSVPIRTLELQPQTGAIRHGKLGVGAGIVHDSQIVDELAECRLKARFLTGLESQFALFETMYATMRGCRNLNRHIERLRASASYFGFGFDEDAIRVALAQACAGLADTQAYRMRLVLEPDGSCHLQTAALAGLTTPVKLLLAPDHTRADDLFLRHKTTVRARYDAAWHAAEEVGAFDMLFVNERGELTEGGRSNLFLRLDGRWLTPSLGAGVLPGVMRSVLLADPAWSATECRLDLDDLRRAEHVVACNSLRGALAAQIVWPS
jgi:para-aminobenzoate synthetase / 4-amino-4-deoxychorismate lyase